MYFDRGTGKREGWLYVYLGSEIEEAAVLLRDEHREIEMAARKCVAELLANGHISHDDDRVRREKVNIENHGKEAEACKVFAHQFRRNPDREFSLSIGDVVYFGLADDS